MAIAIDDDYVNKLRDIAAALRQGCIEPDDLRSYADQLDEVVTELHRAADFNEEDPDKEETR